MELNEKEKKRLEKFLEKYLTPPKSCPVCGNSAWRITDKVFECREFFKGGLKVGGGSIRPFVLLTCGDCGYTLFFNAIRTGIIKKEKKREPKET